MMKDQDQAQCDKEGSAMTAPVKTIVYAYLDNGAPSFILIPDDDPSADKFEAKNTIRLGESTGAHEIQFRLVDSTKLGLKFAADPIWSEDNVDCPKQAGANSSQFSSIAMKGKTLVIEDRNDNQTALKIGYQLNFVDKGGKRVPFDPIIINDGGTRFD